MPPKDEYGIEYSTEVETFLKDPKSTIVEQVLDYRDKRNAAKKEKEDKEKKPPEKFLGIF